MKTIAGMLLGLLLVGCGGGDSGGLDDSVNPRDESLSQAEILERDYDRLKAVYDAGQVWSCSHVRLTTQNGDTVRTYLSSSEWVFSYDPESSHFISYTNNGITYHSNPWEFVRETERDQERRNEYYSFWWSAGYEPKPLWFSETPEFKFRMISDTRMLGIHISRGSGFDYDVHCGALEFSVAPVSGILISTL